MVPTAASELDPPTRLSACVTAFQGSHQGEYDDVEDYARAYVDETGMMVGWSETAMTYFDWERWSSDLETELTTADAPGGGIYVFANP